VIAAEQHACRLVVPSSQQFGAKRWPSHKDHAAKALQKLAGPHLPATLKQLEDEGLVDTDSAVRSGGDGDSDTAADRVGAERRKIRRVDDRSEPVVNALAVIRAATSSSGWLGPTSPALPAAR
jgi:hypothetical protein